MGIIFSAYIFAFWLFDVCWWEEVNDDKTDREEMDKRIQLGMDTIVAVGEVNNL